MTDIIGDTADEESRPAADRMAAVAAGLRASGLAVRVHQTDGVLDVTAVAHPPGRREIEVIADEDSYVQVSWWSPLGTTPAQITAAIGGVLAAITASDGNPD